MTLPLADDNLLRGAVGLLETLAARHGLSDLRLGESIGELVVTPAPERTYFDLADFELEVETLLHARVRVTPASAPGARIRGQLRAPDSTAA